MPIYRQLLLRSFRPTLILLAFLVALGVYLYLTQAPVFWAGYVAIMFFYALVFYTGSAAAGLRQGNTTTDMMLAGRNIPLFIGIFTMSATWIDGGYLNGTAEYTVSQGLVWVQAPWGYAISLLLGGLFFARKMRHYRFRTMLDPLEQRYGKRMAALLSLPALTGEIFWTAAILTALGTTFGTILGLDSSTAIVLSALIAITYTSLGGLWAVALTDTLQLFFLLVGLFVILPFALSHTGGLSATYDAYSQIKGSAANLLPLGEGFQDWGNHYWNWWDMALMLMLGGIPWQVYFQRVLAARSEDAAVKLSIGAAFICLIAAVPAVLVGMVAAVFDWHSIGVDFAEPLFAMPYVIRYLTNPIVATLGLGAIAGAVMSSVDASILSASSVISWNIYRPLVRPEANPERLMKVIQRCVWIVGVGAMLLALRAKSIYALWALCSDFVYCILFPQLTTALFFSKANRYGSIAGFVVSLFLRLGGGDGTLGIPNFLPYPMVENDVVLFPFRTLAMVAGFVTIIIVSLATQKSCPPTVLVKNEEKTDLDSHG